MKERPIPLDLRRFLAGHVDSVLTLEALLLLRRTRDRWYSAESVAAELGTEHLDVETSLETLASKRLLDARLATAVLFRYSPLSPELDLLVARLQDAYASRRLALIELISSNATGAARRFADAFRLRKDREDRGG